MGATTWPRTTIEGPPGHQRDDGSCRCDLLPEVGQRIVVVRLAHPDAEPHMYEGAAGQIVGVFRSTVAVRWDDARLERRGIALMRFVDRWRLQ